MKRIGPQVQPAIGIDRRLDLRPDDSSPPWQNAENP
jgi:hypothetical protein